ncbi:MAG: DUF2339 domain-containing protein [Acidobacteriota bacterium]|nr:DUF2339 domain-containing protein [Acidobacteriota bacterium]
MIPNSAGNLEEQVGELRARIRRLEEALRSRGIVLEGEAAPHLAAGPPAPDIPPPYQASSSETPLPQSPASPVSPPTFGYTGQNQPRPERSLENRIGSQWFNRIGILAVLIGAALFLKLAFDNHWIGPHGRVLIGLLAGAGLIAWSERFQRRGFAAFSYSLKAIGSGVLYLSLWAAFSLYALLPAGAAFAAMIVVTAFNGFMAWIRDAELLALYAIAGGLITPLVVSTGQNHEITLFTYLLILDFAVLIHVALRPWSRLLFFAFLGTAVSVFGWWIGYYSQAQAGRTAFFLVCFFLIFAFAPQLVRAEIIEPTRLSAWDSLAVVILPIANAALGFLALYGLFIPSAADRAGPWLAVAFAAFYLLLLRRPARGALRASPASLSALHLATAVVFLIIAIPLKTHGRWLIIGWLAEGAALLWLAIRLRQHLLQVLALLCLALGLVALLTVNPRAAVTPFLNQRFATYAFAIAIFAFVAWLARKTGNAQNPGPPPSWQALAAASVLIVNSLILLAIGAEIHSYWWHLRCHGNMTAFYDYRIHAQFTYSGFFMIFGAVLLEVGFWRRSAFLRWQALVLLAVTIGKVFLVDMSALSQGLRILSFLGLGALLLAVSFVYQRDWLNLRGQGE